MQKGGEASKLDGRPIDGPDEPPESFRGTKPPTMKPIIEITKYALIALAILIVGFQLAAIARSYSRNQAIDGCYQASAYQANFPENGRNITVTETQKHIFEQCLAIKNIILEPLE